MWRDVYISSFGAINQSLGPNTVCNIVIQRNDIEEEVEVQTIDLAFDAPLTIEWPEQSKEVLVCAYDLNFRCHSDSGAESVFQFFNCVKINTMA